MSLPDWFRGLRRPARKGYAFDAAARTMRQRVESYPRFAEGTGGEILVPILPWRSTAVPFFSIEMGVALAQAGQEVRFLAHFPDLPFHREGQKAMERELIEGVLSQVARRFPVDELNTVWPEQNLPEATLRLWANENTVWLSKSESKAYENPADPLIMEGMRREYDRVYGFMERHRPGLVFLPGGAMGVSAAYVEACRRLKIPLATYDSGRGEIKLCMGGVAAHNEDVPAAFRFFSSCPPDEQAQFRASAESWIVRRREGRDDYQLQLQGTQPFDLRNYLLICLNYRADSAALLRQRLFPTVKEWLAATARWAVENGARLVIRQHPCERLDRFRGRDDWGAIATAADPEGKFVRYISAFDPVNTYDLIEHAAAVLPFTSRVGIESAMLGKPAITSAHTFYAGLGFTHDPADPAEYFALLKAAVDGRLHVTDDQRRAAAIAYFTISEHTRVRTRFTPQPDDFPVWSATAPTELWEQAEVKEMIEVLTSQRPFAIVRHETRPFCAEVPAA